MRRTADGKSLVSQTIAFFRCGVAVFLVPLVGLGSDQVGKATWIEHNVEAYHADEHKKSDATLLISRLLGMSKEEAREITVMLYLSPRALSDDSEWYKLSEISEEGVYIFVLYR